MKKKKRTSHPAHKKTLKDKRILITDSEGFVGSHVVENFLEVRKIDPRLLKRVNTKLYNLRDFSVVRSLVADVDIVIHLASDIGGIAYSNTHQASQLRNCLTMDMNIFEAASQAHVEKIVCLSSAVAYPENSPSPLREETLWNGWPSRGGYGYGFAKRMDSILAKAYKSEKNLDSVVLLAANPYGPGDDFSLENSHVISALIRKCLTFTELTVWGDGSQVRDFIYIKDLAEAVILAAEKLETTDPINISSGGSSSIKDIVNIVTRLTNFKGPVIFDTKRPTGQKERVLDGTMAKSLIGFLPQYSLEEGLKETIAWYNSWLK